MFPTLFELGPISVYSYGVMMALGFLAAMFGARRFAPDIGVNPERMMDMAFFAIIGGLVGSYINYIISYDWSRFSADPTGVLRFWEGGLVFLGGLIGGLVFAVLYIRWQKMPLWEVADIAGIFVPLAYAMGRIGCFMAGCCYGLPAGTAAWAVTFPGHFIARHPTQLYSAALGISLFVFALWFRKYRKFSGQTFLLYLMIYGVGRALIETLRENPFALGTPLTVAQFTGLMLAMGAGVIYPVLMRRNKYSD